jgi:tetratricopeptide (TPR) repeat protein
VNKSVVLGIVGALVCAFAAWESARIGYARTQAINALNWNDVASGERATRWLSADAEVHAARGVVLQRTENYADACRELERAIQLRPRDYFLWMMLGVTRDLNDDPTGGLAALQESVRLAPFYAKPRWLAGNLLLRMGQVDEAFQHLRFAAERDATLLPNVIDLAWGISGNDPGKTVELVAPQTDAAHMALAIFLAAHQEGVAAVDQYRKVKFPPIGASNQLIEKLIESRFFWEADYVFRAHCSRCTPEHFVNGSFEDDVEVGNRTFGWQIPSDVSGVTLSVDDAEHADRARSLRLDFQGNTNPQTVLLSQIVTVDRGTRYRISFHAMTRSFVSAASPVVRIIDASDEKLAVLGEAIISANASSWQNYAVDFVTGQNSQAVRVIVGRTNCPNNSCAAFGTVWFDSFSFDHGSETPR